MILNTMYIACKISPDSQTRFDVKHSFGQYDIIENLCLNKRKLNVGGLSFYCGKKPDKWKNGVKADMAITKGTENITSIYRPDPDLPVGYGDIKGTIDACLIIYNQDFKTVGVKQIILLIAKGLKNDQQNLYNQYINGDLQSEIDSLKKQLVNRFKSVKQTV